MEDLSISVIIITRNRADCLKDTLASLTGQSYQPDEVVVVDNASEDNTKDTVLSFKEKLNILYVYEARRGIPYARNTGLLSATGDIIVTLDDDCVATDDWLKYIIRPFARDPNIGVVGGEVSYFMMGDGNLETFYMRNMVSRGRSR